MFRFLPVLTLCAPVLAQSTYSLSPIDPPVAAVSVFAGGLDDAGNVLLNVAVTQNGRELWVSGPSGVRKLTTVPSQKLPYAVDLANSGRVLGTMDGRPTVWNPFGQPRFLRHATNSLSTEIAAGTSAGWLVGAAYFFGGYEGGPVVPTLWVQDQLVLLDAPPGSIRAWCTDINEHHRIVGGCAIPTGPSSARGMGWVRDGLQPPVSIGWPDGQQLNLLTSVNNGGEAVGYAYSTSGVVESFRWNDGIFTTVPGAGALLEIARDGTALGLIENYPLQLVEPTVSIGAHAWNLQQLLDPVSGAGWDLISAVNINDSGQIVCDAFDPLGKRRVVLLAPISGAVGGGSPRRARTPEQISSAEQSLAPLRLRLDPLHRSR